MLPVLCTSGFLLLVLTCKVETVTFEQSSSQVVKEGREELRINCSHDDSSLQVMLWYQHKQSSQSMSLIGFTVLQGEPNYENQFKNRFNLTREETVRGSLIIRRVNSSDSAVYFCAARSRSDVEAYFGQGTKLTVLENDRTAKAPTVKVLPPSSKECRKQKYQHRRKTLVCVATEFYPDHVSVFWQIDGKKVTRGVATDNTALRDGDDYRITSRLRVSANDWYTPDSRFTCIVSFFDGTKTKNYQNSIFGEKEVTMTRGKYLKITNNAKLSYGVFIVKSSVYGAFVVFLVWKLQGKHN